MKELTIAIVEDEKIYATELLDMLNEWATVNQFDVRLFTYDSGELFVQNFETVDSLDLVFLDIHLGIGINGIEAAKEVRGKGYEGKIVLLTNYQSFEFARAGYSIDALDYLNKPLANDKLDKLLKKIVVQKNFEYCFNGIYVSIPYTDILYFESDLHRTKIVVRGETVQARFINQGIGVLEKQLPEGFIRCHRCFIVNVMHIEQIKQMQILLGNQERISIGRRYAPNVTGMLNHF